MQTTVDWTAAEVLGDSEAITVYWSEGRETYYYILYIRNAYVHIHDVLRVASLPLSAVVRDVRYAAHAPTRRADSARGLHFVCSPSGRGRGLTSVERREVNGARSSL